MIRLTTLMKAEKTITIMPDFGNGPWAWEKDSTDETTYVGGCIASAEWMDGRYHVSGGLKKEFGEWVSRFENQCKDEGFDWTAFHRRGMELAKRLKQELGDRVKIVYAKPVEDPNHKSEEQTEITGN